MRSGISWSGFNVTGDQSSVAAVKDALHESDVAAYLRVRCAEQQKVEQELRAALRAEMTAHAKTQQQLDIERAVHTLTVEQLDAAKGDMGAMLWGRA